MSDIPSVMLGSVKCRRILHGLWQTGGSWGKIDNNDAVKSMSSLINKGFTTFDGADHYGPAEILMGEIISNKKECECFTKWCPRPGDMSMPVVESAINTSLKKMRTSSLDLLQFHWWEYGMDKECLQALENLKTLKEKGKIKELGLTNFDTVHLKSFIDNGIPIVQYSVIDMRPAKLMAPYCKEKGIKLLCYGTLGGGLITDKFLGKPEPSSKKDLPTPSLGKYYNMIRQWGSWELFQEMLRTLRKIADKHGVDIAQVATKFILDQEAVGGVIVGLRAGLSDHANDNLKTFSLSLSEEDKKEILKVNLKGKDLLSVIGDTGDEYRG